MIWEAAREETSSRGTGLSGGITVEVILPHKDDLADMWAFYQYNGAHNLNKFCALKVKHTCNIGIRSDDQGASLLRTVI